MQTSPHGWTIIDADAGVLSFSYGFGAEGQANSFTARLASGGLLVVSPAAGISAEALDELEAHGPVEALAANNGFHYLGVARWRERFPKARCFAADGARARIAKRSKKPLEFESLSALAPLLAEGTAVVEAPSSKCGETWARAAIEGGHAWYSSDILANMDQLPKKFPFRMMFKLTKSAPGYRVFNLAVKFILKDKKASLGAMLAEVRAHPPTVMVPGHGSILTGPSLAGDTAKLLEGAL